MDVLVFTPVLRIEPETVQAITSLEWDGPISFLLQRDNPFFTRQGIRDRVEAQGVAEIDEAHANVLHQYQRGRETFLAGRYDAMLVIEHDIIPPPDALIKLAALEADLAYGVYMFRGKMPVVNVMRRYYPWPQASRNVGESLSLYPEMWEKALKDGQTECSGAGLGCVLIQRKVIEEVPFEPPRDRGYFDNEWLDTVHAAKYKMMADMSVMCGHKSADGQVLWPVLRRSSVDDSAQDT